MKKIRITLTIDKDINERWASVVNRLGMTKSGMVQDFLHFALPILEEQEPKQMMRSILEAMELLYKDESKCS